MLFFSVEIALSQDFQLTHVQIADINNNMLPNRELSSGILKLLNIIAEMRKVLKKSSLFNGMFPNIPPMVCFCPEKNAQK